MARLAAAVVTALPSDLLALIEPEVVVSTAFPPTVRVPDIVVCGQTVKGQTVGVNDVILAVEIVSPGSRRVDHVLKRSEYREAGIPHYWIIDLDDEVHLTALTLTENGYDEVVATGVFSSDEPFPFLLDLESLTGG